MIIPAANMLTWLLLIYPMINISCVPEDASKLTKSDYLGNCYIELFQRYYAYTGLDSAGTIYLSHPS